MPLPWLIGAAAVVLVSAVVKAANSSDSGDSSDDDAREARRRAAAERERAENERKKKIQTATMNFVSRGDSIGRDIAESLSGWIDVEFERSPVFAVKLNSSGYEIDHSGVDKKIIHTLIPDGSYNFNKTRENLEFYSNVYAVKLQMGPRLLKTGKDIQRIDSELEQIMRIKGEISRLKSYISAQS